MEPRFDLALCSDLAPCFAHHPGRMSAREDLRALVPGVTGTPGAWMIPASALGALFAYAEVIGARVVFDARFGVLLTLSDYLD